MISRPFALVGFSFVFTLLALGIVSDVVTVFVVCAVALIAVAIFIKRLSGRAEYAVCGLCVIAACISFNFAQKVLYAPALSFVGNNLEVRATVEDIESANANTYYTLRTSHIGDIETEQTLRLRQKEPLEISVGDGIELTGDISKIGRSEETHNYYKSKGIFLRCESDDITQIIPTDKKPTAYYIYMLRHSASENLLKFVGEEVGGLAIGMLTGDKVYLSPLVNNSFRVCGLSHTLAVSGLHMNIIVMALYTLVSRLLPRFKRIAAAICIPIALFYCAFSGFSVSAVRACVMIVVIMLAKVISRRDDSLNSLGLAALLISLFSPFAVLDWSFMLSFSSTLGIVVCAPFIRKLSLAILSRIKVRKLAGLIVSIYETAAITCVATAFTLPVMVMFVGQVSLVFLPANLATFFAVPAFMVLSAFTAVFGFLPFAFPAEASAFVCRWIGKYLLKTVELLSGSSFVSVKSNSFALKLWLGGALIAVALAVYLVRNRKKAFRFSTAFVSASLALTCTVSAVENKGTVSVTAVNVKDDACYIVSHGTSAVVIGCACADYVMSGVLDELGVIRIELALVTACTDENDLELIEISKQYAVERVVVPCGYSAENLPKGYEESDDFSYDFYGSKITYKNLNGYDLCRLDSESGSVLFTFGTLTPSELLEDLSADFLFTKAQPPLTINTASYKAVVISAGGNTYINSKNSYSTNDYGNIILRFNAWCKYKINSF
ncbi:MAG: ComEC/Rec2 family competence protein [Clostridia bacterium]|nr:ComEC/Rec2 family competence protein [Clostridia bacterium]